MKAVHKATLSALGFSLGAGLIFLVLFQLFFGEIVKSPPKSVGAYALILAFASMVGSGFLTVLFALMSVFEFAKGWVQTKRRR